MLDIGLKLFSMQTGCWFGDCLSVHRVKEETVFWLLLGGDLEQQAGYA